jgi:hypothetical protein
MYDDARLATPKFETVTYGSHTSNKKPEREFEQEWRGALQISVQ